MSDPKRPWWDPVVRAVLFAAILWAAGYLFGAGFLAGALEALPRIHIQIQSPAPSANAAPERAV